jgi:hypothetical protein
MNRVYGDQHFTSSSVRDNIQGFAGLELHRICQGKRDRVAQILFWDACGQFSIETFGTDVPLEIVEELIAEAKQSIKEE